MIWTLFTHFLAFLCGMVLVGIYAGFAVEMEVNNRLKRILGPNYKDNDEAGC